MSRPGRRRLQVFLLWFNGAQALIWLIALPVSLLTGLKSSLPFLVFLSVWALEAAAVAGLTAALLSNQMEDNNT